MQNLYKNTFFRPYWKYFSMDGVFMKKIGKRIAVCATLWCFFWVIGLIMDHYVLSNQLIRMHVIANSDSTIDQDIKLKVRDAVLAGIESDLNQISDVDSAKLYLQESLPKIERIANDVLSAAGFEEVTVASMCKEAFPVRYYDTFSLPAGIYESLKIVIGEGKGHNWWCVAFPSLCTPVTAEAFSEQAMDAGFSKKLSDTLTGETEYQIRFFLLDLIGQLENRFLE